MTFTQADALVATVVVPRPLPRPCTGCAERFAGTRVAGWSHDGQRLINGAPQRPEQVSLILGMIAVRPRFTAGDDVLIWNELVDFTTICNGATRQPANPSQLIGQPQPVAYEECNLGDQGPEIFNAPQGVATGADQSAMRE